MQGDFRINDWLVQPQINSVEKNGETWHLEPKVMQVLVQLASHPNQVLSKEKLLDAVWHDTFVGDDVLVRCISEIRYVFGDDPRSSRVIQTIPKGGYRLIAPVSERISFHEGNPSHYESVPVEHPPLNGNGHASAEVAYISEAPLDKTELRDAAIVEKEVAIAASHPAHAVTRHRNLAVGLGALLVILLGFWGGTYAWKATHKSALDSFWDPVLSGNDPVLFCIADQNQYSAVALRDADDPSHVTLLKDNLTAVIIDDLNAVIQITGYLKASGKQYSLKGAAATNFKDMQSGPTIFVGAFDNMWTLRLTHQLRFRFANNSEMNQFSIMDSASTSHKTWTVNRGQQMSTNNYRDYAIVARFTDANTEKPAVVIAGISRGGTIAAAEFATNPTYLAQLQNSLRNSGGKNVEIVLSTPIIDGLPGPPQIEALYTW